MDLLFCQTERSGCFERRLPLSCLQENTKDHADGPDITVVAQPALNNFTWSRLEASCDDSKNIAPPEVTYLNASFGKENVIDLDEEAHNAKVECEQLNVIDEERLNEFIRSEKFPRKLLRHFTLSGVHRSNKETLGLDRAICPGDVLNVKGDNTASAITRLGSVGGFMGHVMVVVASPRAISRESPESSPYLCLWPHDISKLWRVRVIESCSGASGLHESDMLVYVNRSGQIFALGEEDGEDICKYEQRDQIYLWNAPPQLRKHNFRIEIMYEVLDDMRAHQENWSWSTAIRAFVRSGELSSDGQHPASLSEVRDAWKAAPICTSVVVSFWQRYLEKIAVFDTADPLSLIMRFMPLKADRVLPGELLMTMLERGWSVREAVPAKLDDARGFKRRATTRAF